MKKTLSTLIGTSVVAAMTFIGATQAQAATIGSCTSNIGPLAGNGGVGASGFEGASSCTNSDDDNDTETDVENIFGGDWTFAYKTDSPATTNGNLTVTYDGGAPSKTGEWDISGFASGVTSFIIAVKGGSNEPTAVLYYKFDDLTVLSGDWSTFGLINNGGNQPDLSHLSVYTSSTGVVPEPLTILGAGAAIGFGASFKRKLAQSKKQGKKDA